MHDAQFSPDLSLVGRRWLDNDLRALGRYGSGGLATAIPSVVLVARVDVATIMDLLSQCYRRILPLGCRKVVEIVVINEGD